MEKFLYIVEITNQIRYIKTELFATIVPQHLGERPAEIQYAIADIMEYYCNVKFLIIPRLQPHVIELEAVSYDNALVKVKELRAEFLMILRNN